MDLCDTAEKTDEYLTKLLVQIEELEHDELIRDDQNLIYNLYLSFPDAALGTTAEIPTLDGKVKVKIEQGIQPGKILRLRGKGLPDVNSYGKGDILVNINVWIPKNLSKDEKKIMEKFSKSENFDPKPTSSDKSFFERMKNYFG